MKFDKNKYDLAILVVLYNCHPENSMTVNGVIKCLSYFSDKKIKILLWNNGPVVIQNYHEFLGDIGIESNISITCIESVENAALSNIYNFFLQHVDACAYTLFDGDSEVGNEFLHDIFAAQQSKVDLLVPHVMMHEKVQGPVVNGEVLKVDSILELKDIDSFFAIGSGITIYKSGLEKIKNTYSTVFDENYALYGVDTSFWLRVISIATCCPIRVMCKGVLNHVLSRLEKEDQHVVAFRRKERGWDVGITMRRYPSVDRYWDILKLAVKRVIFRRSVNSGMPSLHWAIWALMIGSHPRSKIKFSPVVRYSY